jgi:hypothetical protein
VLVLAGACRFAPAPIGATGDAGIPSDADAAIVSHDAPIAIGVVQQNQNINSGSHANVGASFDTPQLDGDLIVVVLSWGGGMTSVVVGDNSGNTFHPLHAVVAGGGVGQAAFYAENIHAAPANVVNATLGSNQSNPAMRMIEYSGIATTNAFDSAAVATGNNNAADSGPLVTTHAHELLVGASTNAGNVGGAGTGWTQEVIFDGDVLEDREVTTLGTYDATAMLSPQAWIMLIAGFRAAS